MPVLKTAISLEDRLLREAEGLARRMKVSRSRLFATAMAEFLERRRNRALFLAINAVYEGGPDPTEARLRRAQRRHHRRLVRTQW